MAEINEAAKQSSFEILNKVDVSRWVEKKNGLSYVSWANAWCEVKKRFPQAVYTIYERVHPEFGPINYFSDGHTCWVKTGVTIEGIEHIEELPVMDYKNRSILAENVTSFDVNKAIQRSLTKALARHGLGLYIYAGEDLPEQSDEAKAQAKWEEETISKSGQGYIEHLLETTESDVEKFLKYFGIKELWQMKNRDYKKAVLMLESKVKSDD